jgi:hypothetical protein
MKYLSNFERYIDYQEALENGEIVAPNVSFIEDEARCIYHSKNKSEIGDVVLYDRDSGEYLFVSPTAYKEGFWQDLMKYPIGVVAISTKYTPDGSTRVVSLKNMSMKTPDSGSTATGGTAGDNSMYWGGYNVDIPTLKNYNQVVSIDAATGEYKQMDSWTRIPSDTQFNSTGYVDSCGHYYYMAADNTDPKGPYPILSNGEKNPLFYYEGSAMNDFDGSSNTDKIIAMSDGTTYANWKTASTITHSYDAGNYPPAFCCRRYSTQYGTKQGDWYLPASGESMFLTSHYGAINAGLSAVAACRGASEAIRLGRDGTYGNWLWSSSEYSSTGARDVLCSRGDCNRTTKSYVDTYNRVRAFFQV